jgi:putative FmdB family regulatory protein
MPLYDFQCARCGKPFEEFVSSHDSTPACPTCEQQDKVERVPFGKVTVGRKENLSPPFIKGTRPRRR